MRPMAETTRVVLDASRADAVGNRRVVARDAIVVVVVVAIADDDISTTTSFFVR